MDVVEGFIEHPIILCIVHLETTVSWDTRVRVRDTATRAREYWSHNSGWIGLRSVPSTVASGNSCAGWCKNGAGLCGSRRTELNGPNTSASSEIENPFGVRDWCEIQHTVQHYPEGMMLEV